MSLSQTSFGNDQLQRRQSLHVVSFDYNIIINYM
jgi:hypothetical protein